ncbi:MAG: hypothetical protein JWR49_3852 [Tardiphaga sp.]|nr:hypothetical protein [Tardiphaga sp.]
MLHGLLGDRLAVHGFIFLAHGSRLSDLRDARLKYVLLHAQLDGVHR